MPPALVWAVAFAVPWGLRRYGWTPVDPVPEWMIVIGGVLLTAAVLLGVGAVIQFVAARTTVDPHRVRRASRLVTGGVYRITRNPMYLALLLVLLASAVREADPLALACAGGFVAYLNRFQIAPEERTLADLFGEEYEAFRRRTRRWI